jgi:hypothetical protein
MLIIDEITSIPGATISLMEALVDILMHAWKSGSEVPAQMPGSSLSCLLISLTISSAALPTDFMVNAENA